MCPLGNRMVKAKKDLVDTELGIYSDNIAAAAHTNKLKNMRVNFHTTLPNAVINFFYSYIIGSHLNFFNKAPNIVPTLQLFRFKSNNEREAMKKNLNFNLTKAFDKIDKSMPYTMKGITPYIADVCENPHMYVCETLEFENAITLTDFIRTKKKNSNFGHDLLTVLYQVYAFLYIYHDIFTHNSLHARNVILISVPKRYFSFKYITENGDEVNFHSRYLAKIINYETCYIKNVSKKLAEKLCKNSDCNKCEKYTAFSILGDDHEPGDGSKQRNITNDCLLMSSVYDLLTKPTKKDAYYWAYEFVQYSPVDITIGYAPENTTNGHMTEEFGVHNIIDAYGYLFQHFFRGSEETKFPKYTGCKLYGTFEINTGFVKTISTNRTKRNKNEFKFTPA